MDRRVWLNVGDDRRVLTRAQSARAWSDDYLSETRDSGEYLERLIGNAVMMGRLRDILQGVETTRLLDRDTDREVVEEVARLIRDKRLSLECYAVPLEPWPVPRFRPTPPPRPEPPPPRPPRPGPEPPEPPKPKPEDADPTVKITKFDCRFVGKTKKIKVEAEGTPPGGTFNWKTTGGISIASGQGTKEVEVQGDTTSSKLDDCTLTVEYSLKGKTATDSMKLTVYEITKIEAKLPNTPCRGVASNTMPAKSSTTDSRVFDAATTTIVKGCGDLNMVATVAPAGTPVSWVVERATDDEKSLTGLPTHADDGGAFKRKLTANATGSFHVIVFHDCKKKGKPEADDLKIILNVNIVDIEVTGNSIISRNTLFRDVRSTAAFLIVDSGSTGGTAPGVNAAYTDAEFTKHPLNMKMTVTLIGGGADRRRGAEKVRLGFIQTTTADSVTGTYADGRTLKEVIVQNAGTADPITGGTPAMLAFPVRDTRGNSRSASGPFIISSSDVETSNLPTGGIQRVVRFVDPPAIVLNRRHPVTNSALASISGSNDFEAFLSAYSTDFNENYAVAASARWSALYGTFTPAGGWTNAGASINVGATMGVFSPPKRGADVPLERCPPNFVDNIKMDAR